MQTQLFLISHAATAALRSGRFPADDPLDSRGLDAAAARHERFVTTLFDAGSLSDAVAFSSPAICAQQTAHALHLDAQIEPALAEADHGEWKGQRVADIAGVSPESASSLQAWTHDPAAVPPGGESFDALRIRVGAWLDGLTISGTAIAVTHASVVRASIIHALGASTAIFPRIEVAPLSVVALRRSMRGWVWCTGPT
ncbi:histidine phosphatase family protein [Paraburkholderia sp.]|uniref:histidine phosphatase family protein n=1 Tax=Paraburkholderia sp. TaxID=1926495 RepID=UPI00238CF975|nr:histidine phosphatase family protein [Paraburkholderia sp.]MDE1181662.1 histidine phosphatase family protein [Paraburkholderia sp.]